MSIFTYTVNSCCIKAVYFSYICFNAFDGVWLCIVQFIVNICFCFCWNVLCPFFQYLAHFYSCYLFIELWCVLYMITSPHSIRFMQTTGSCRPLVPADHWFLQTTGSCRPLVPADHWFLQTTGSCRPLVHADHWFLQTTGSCRPLVPQIYNDAFLLAM